jgi:hypothetical protein
VDLRGFGVDLRGFEHVVARAHWWQDLTASRVVFATVTVLARLAHLEHPAKVITLLQWRFEGVPSSAIKLAGT